jgi:hypothetical protein
VNGPNEDPIQEFRSLCEQAEVAYSHPDSCGDPELLPFGQRILELIAQHPSRQADFDQAFRDLWHQRFTGPWELIPFCMHYLRWPDFHEFITRIHSDAVRTSDWRCIPVTRQVLDSFTEGDVSFETYYAKLKGPEQI